MIARYLMANIDPSHPMYSVPSDAIAGDCQVLSYYQSAGGGFTAWIDDIAVGHERIGDKYLTEPMRAARR